MSFQDVALQDMSLQAIGLQDMSLQNAGLIIQEKERPKLELQVFL